MRKYQDNPKMQAAKDSLIESLTALVDADGLKSHVNELGAYITRLFPHERLTVAAITNPARFGEPGSRDVGEKKGSTWVHPKLREASVTEATAAPAKKKGGAKATGSKPAAEEPESPTVDPETAFGPDALGKTDDELLEITGGLAGMKALLSDHFGVTVAKNAGKEKTIAAFREALEILNA